MLKDETDPATQNVRKREFQAKGLKQRKNFESWEQISDYVKPQLYITPSNWNQLYPPRLSFFP